MAEQKENTPWFLWPFKALWDLLAFIVKATGRLIAAVIGLVIMIAGLVLTITVVGAVAGIPMMIFGFLLMVRGIF